MNYAGQCLFPASSQHKGGCHMVQITITLDNTTAAFYQHVSGLAGLPLETVLSDALFKLAGELSLEAMKRKEKASC